MTHAWCRDVARDERVRAAEDGRTGPLPTLEECIETAFSAGVRDSFRKVEEAWAMIPKSVSASSPVDQENKGDGMATHGMRTERITLEIVHYGPESAAGWEWKYHIRPRHIFESVRVVEEACPDAWAQTFARLEAERDAAIRERDAAVAESERRLRLCETMKKDGDSARFHAAVAQARVAELEAASGGGEPVAWMVEWTDHAELYGSKTQAERAADGDVVPQPLYRSPPQPRGWLTGEEREAVQWAADAAYDKQHPAEDTLRNILARSTPPEVALPDWVKMCVSHGRQNQLLAALAAAGVAVKEVGK